MSTKPAPAEKKPATEPEKKEAPAKPVPLTTLQGFFC